MEIKDIQRPSRELTQALAEIGTATASSELSKMGLQELPHPGPQVPDTGSYGRRSGADPAIHAEA